MASRPKRELARECFFELFCTNACALNDMASELQVTSPRFLTHWLLFFDLTLLLTHRLQEDPHPPMLILQKREILNASQYPVLKRACILTAPCAQVS